MEDSQVSPKVHMINLNVIYNNYNQQVKRHSPPSFIPTETSRGRVLGGIQLTPTSVLLGKHCAYTSPPLPMSL